MKATDWLPLLFEAADRADEISLRHFRAQGLRVDRKPDRTLVSEADLAIESAVRALVEEREPALGIFGEEQGEAEGASGARLIIDPIDATENFVRGISVFATLLAIEVEGEIQAGLVSAPALHQRWHAARGAGAFAGARRLHVSGIDILEEAQLFHGSLAGSEAVPATATLSALITRTRRQRGFGDFYQHALVAEGCGEIAVDPAVSPWDVAPLQVLVEEAGGRATSLTGERSIYAGSLISTNGALHDLALSALGS